MLSLGPDQSKSEHWNWILLQFSKSDRISKSPDTCSKCPGLPSAVRGPGQGPWVSTHRRPRCPCSPLAYSTRSHRKSGHLSQQRVRFEVQLALTSLRLEAIPLVFEPFSKLGTYGKYFKDVFYSNEEINWKRDKSEMEDRGSKEKSSKRTPGRADAGWQLIPGCRVQSVQPAAPVSRKDGAQGTWHGACPCADF